MKKYQTLLYYCYSPIQNPEEYAAEHLAFCEANGILGRIIIAKEGLNGTVSGTVVQCRNYINYVLQDPRFKSTDFKIDAVDEPSFERLYVRVKPEIVHSGLREDSGIDPNKKTGIHLEPNEVLEMLDKEDVVFLDVRSNYESNLGHFKNAVLMDIDNFRNFPEKISEIEYLKNKKVITYCTGGIKCEKASAFLLENGFQDVFQVHGGIVKYAKETGGKDFEGKLYVFDNRVAVDVNSVNPKIVSRCKICGTSSAHMVNCANADCNEHFVLCEKCGEKMEGCCSASCVSSPNKREYDGTGYYSRC